MSSKSTKENFQKFLLKETNYKIRVIKKQAYSNIEEINKANNKNLEITNDDVEKYIKDNFIELNKKADEVVSETCEKLVLKNEFLEFLINFTILSVVFIPTLYPLIRVVCEQLKQDDTQFDYVATAGFSIVLISVLLGISIFTYIKIYLNKNK